MPYIIFSWQLSHELGLGSTVDASGSKASVLHKKLILISRYKNFTPQWKFYKPSEPHSQRKHVQGTQREIECVVWYISFTNNYEINKIQEIKVLHITTKEIIFVQIIGMYTSKKHREWSRCVTPWRRLAIIMFMNQISIIPLFQSTKTINSILKPILW